MVTWNQGGSSEREAVRCGITLTGFADRVSVGRDQNQAKADGLRSWQNEEPFMEMWNPGEKGGFGREAGSLA